MNKQGTLFAEEARHGVPYNEELKWVCDSCGDVITTPTLKGCRSIEAQQWIIVHYSDWSVPEKWKTLRYCPKCGGIVVESLPTNYFNE